MRCSNILDNWAHNLAYHFVVTLSQGRLADVFHTHGANAVVNTYAVVLSFTSPSQTKRGDWMMTLNLVDESCSEKAITAVLFCKERGHLPGRTFAEPGPQLSMEHVPIRPLHILRFNRWQRSLYEEFQWCMLYTTVFCLDAARVPTTKCTVTESQSPYCRLHRPRQKACRWRDWSRRRS